MEDLLNKVTHLMHMYEVNTLMTPNTIIMPRDVYYELKRQAESLSRFYKIKAAVPEYNTFQGLRVVVSDSISDIRVCFMEEVKRA